MTEQVRTLGNSPDDVPQLGPDNLWLIYLRWLAAGGIVGSALVARVLHYSVPLGALVVLGLVVGAYNVALWLAARRLAAEPSRHAQAAALANGQILLDLFALAALLHLGGGWQNPFVIYFVFHMIIAGILLSPAAAYAQATVALGLYSAVTSAEQWNFIPRVVVFGRPAVEPTALDVLVRIGVFGSALYITVYLTTTISAVLRQRERELHQALADVRRHAQSCEVALDGLQKAQQMQLRYMRKVAHELRAPLSSIVMMDRALLEGLAGEVAEKPRGMIERTHLRAENALDLVEDLLTLSRLRDAPLQEAATEVTVADLVAEVMAEMADAAGFKSLALDSELSGSPAQVPGQPVGLRTMLGNLVGNAIKYTPAGGQVLIRTREAEGGDLLLSVADTGVGIAQEDIPRLFEEFYRTAEARSSQIHGTGLGLSIVQEVVQAHHGTVRVESELGKGTVVEVRLSAGNKAQTSAA